MLLYDILNATVRAYASRAENEDIADVVTTAVALAFRENLPEYLDYAYANSHPNSPLITQPALFDILNATVRAYASGAVDEDIAEDIALAFRENIPDLLISVSDDICELVGLGNLCKSFANGLFQDLDAPRKYTCDGQDKFLLTEIFGYLLTTFATSQPIGGRDTPAGSASVSFAGECNYLCWAAASNGRDNSKYGKIIKQELTGRDILTCQMDCIRAVALSSNLPDEVADNLVRSSPGAFGLDTYRRFGNYNVEYYPHYNGKKVAKHCRSNPADNRTAVEMQVLKNIIFLRSSTGSENLELKAQQWLDRDATSREPNGTEGLGCYNAIFGLVMNGTTAQIDRYGFGVDRYETDPFRWAALTESRPLFPGELGTILACKIIAEHAMHPQVNEWGLFGRDGAVKDFNTIPYGDCTNYQAGQPPNSTLTHDFANLTYEIPSLYSGNNTMRMYTRSIVTPQFGHSKKDGCGAYYLPRGTAAFDELRAPNYLDSNVTLNNAFQSMQFEMKTLSNGVNGKFSAKDQMDILGFYDNKFSVRAYLGFTMLAAGLPESALPLLVYGLNNVEHNSIMIAWEAKFKYNVFRPRAVAALQNNTVFGFDRSAQKFVSMPGSAFEPVIDEMSHPSYPSGSASICQAYADYYTTVADHFNLTINTKGAPGMEFQGCYANDNCGLQDFADLCSRTRIMAGLHFPDDINSIKEHIKDKEVGKKGFEAIKSELTQIDMGKWTNVSFTKLINHPLETILKSFRCNEGINSTSGGLDDFDNILDNGLQLFQFLLVDGTDYFETFLRLAKTQTHLIEDDNSLDEVIDVVSNFPFKISRGLL